MLAASFGHRGDPLLLPTTTPPKVSPLTTRFRVGDLNDGAVAHIRVHVSTTADEESLYDFSVEMTALLEKGENARDLSRLRILEIGAALLFPYVRETVSNLTARGRFGPIWLHPFNVRAAVAEGEAEAGADSQAPTGA